MATLSHNKEKTKLESNIIEIVKEVPVDRIVEVVKHIEVPVVKEVQVFVDKIVEVVKYIEVPIDRIVEVIKEVPVEIEKIVNKEVEIIKNVEVPSFINRIVVQYKSPDYIKAVIIVQSIVIGILLLSLKLK